MTNGAASATASLRRMGTEFSTDASGGVTGQVTVNAAKSEPQGSDARPCDGSMAAKRAMPASGRSAWAQATMSGSSVRYTTCTVAARAVSASWMDSVTARGNGGKGSTNTTVAPAGGCR